MLAMKKAIISLTIILFALTFLYPLGYFVLLVFGYSFVLSGKTFMTLIIAVLSVLVNILSANSKVKMKETAMGPVIAILTPFALFCCAFYIFDTLKWYDTILMLIAIGCFFALLLREGRPKGLKIPVSIISGILASIVFLSAPLAVLWNFGEDYVIQTAASPYSSKYVELIASSQGALGGDTLVNVRDTRTVDFVIFHIEKRPITIYHGRWSDHADMKIHWKDDDTIVINGTEYEIP